MTTVAVHVNEGFLPMVDGSLVYHRGFGDRPSALTDPAPSLTLRPRVFRRDGSVVLSRHYPLNAALPPGGRPAPGRPDPLQPGAFLVRRAHWASFFPERTLVAEVGATLRIRVRNNLAQPHALQFLGVSPGGGHVGTGDIEPGRTALLEFPAPAAGTYIYCDPGSDPARPEADPVQRLLGLHGALLVTDPAAPWRAGRGGPEFERQWVWILADVDPAWAAIAARQGAVDPATTPAYPRYFTLNGRSGFQSLGVSTDETDNLVRSQESLMSGSARVTDVRDFSRGGTADAVRTGQLVRFVNAGVVSHQLHFHGNHVWTLGRNGTPFPRTGGSVDADGHVVLQQWEDVVQVRPLDRKDCMLPLVRPPESTDEVWNARTTDWGYPMHCHAEPSQVARGGMYPAGLVGHWTVAAPVGSDPEPHERYRSQVDFSSNQPHEGSPETEFLRAPDVAMDFQFFNQRMTFDDGGRFEVWCFQTPTSGRVFPAPLVRLTEGQLFHGTLHASKGVHTLHWHGIEPDPRNDGVGHTSFEVSGRYTYQWRAERGAPGNPNVGSAGTYFYHCHVNTPLHVQRGMFGALVVDPVVHPDFPVSPGARRAFVDGPEYDVATEAILVPFAVDPRWHELDHAAGLSGEDVGLDRFEPKHLYLLGGELAGSASRDAPTLLTRIRANVATASGGAVKPTLLRLLNGTYFPVNASFTDAAGRRVAMAELVSHDGRPFRDTSRPAGPARPISLAGPLVSGVVNFGAAERYDMLLRPPVPGTYTLTIDLLHWITGAVLGRRRATITAR